MLSLSGNARILLYQRPVDLRKGFEGLSSLLEMTGNDELTSGAYFVFLNRRRDRMKVLYWDSDGLVIWYKLLQKGSFPKGKMEKALIDRREFLMLLEGITPKRVQKRFRVK